VSLPIEHRRHAPSARSLQKGQATRAALVDAALALASNMGLEGLSIGALAEVTGMSKSGVFAHFGSREELQISVIREYHAKFEEEVFLPRCASARPAAPARAVRALGSPVSVELDSGCIYISGAVEIRRPARAPCAMRWPRWCWPGTRRSNARSAWRWKRAICVPTPTPCRCSSSCTG
jgi:AcrR family transcriptional regulator